MTAEVARYIVLLMSGGAVVALIGWARERWRSRQPAVVESANLQATAQALATVSAARDELQEDNARLRRQVIDERAYYLAEIERIRGQLLAALKELDRIQSMHNPGGQPGHHPRTTGVDQ